MSIVCPLVKSIEEQEKERAIKENWIRLAVQFLRVFMIRERAVSNCVLFTAEDVAKAAFEDCIPDPGSLRAWGPVFQRAKREGLIQQARNEITGAEYRVLTGSKHRSPLWEPGSAANA